MRDRLRLGCLGERTNSRKAAERAGERYEAVGFQNMDAVFESLGRGEVDRIIVPVENSITGRIGNYYNRVIERGLRVIDEIVIPIVHCIAARSEQIGFVLSHEQALMQCAGYLDLHFPESYRGAVCSTEEAARMISQASTNGAAIASLEACTHYRLRMIAQDIAKGNKSKFWVCEK
jgi:prephenate dehydratase